MYYAQKKIPPVAAVITMRIFFVKYFLSTEVVLAESQNCKKRAKAVSAHGCPLATIKIWICKTKIECWWQDKFRI